MILRGPVAESDRVLVSQTCDVVQEKHPTVLLAPLVHLEGAAADQARGGHRPRYIAVGDRFVDLAFITAVAKNDVPDGDWGEPFATGSEGERDFGLRIARYFGRFAFPDDVVPALRPLEKAILDKYSKVASSLGSVMRDQVAQIRVREDGNWRGPRYSATVYLVVRDGFLPDTEPAKVSDAALALGSSELAVIADEIVHERWRDADLVHLWSCLGDRLVDKSRKAARADGTPILDEVSVEVTTDRDFSLADYRKSQELDLDYLSGADQ